MDAFCCHATILPYSTVFVTNTKNNKTDLFIVDLAQPEKPTLLYENVLSAYSVWSADTDWIGFIAKVNWIPQIFVIRADGSSLTQVTNSTIGALAIGSVLNDGVFWSEGKRRDNYFTLSAYKWTKFDGTEIQLDGPEIDFRRTAGKYVISESIDFKNDSGCTRKLYDLESGETREISFTKVNPEMKCHDMWPISDDVWIVGQLGSFRQKTNAQYWFYSSEGTLLKSFADLPFDHERLPNIDNVSQESLIFDYYKPIEVLVTHSRQQMLSPDGNLILIEHFKSDETIFEGGYYLLNISSFELEKLPGLIFKYDRHGRKLSAQEGISVRKYFWVEIP
jgi:hypothetical protein